MKNIWLYIGFALVLFFGLKSCISRTISIDDYIIAERTDNHGQHDKVIFTPQNEIIQIKQYKEIIEYCVCKLKGQESTHYFLGIYNIRSKPLGIRYLRDAEKVFDAQIFLSKKEGLSFPKIGSSFYTSIEIYPNRIKIGKDLYKRSTLNEDDKKILDNYVKQIKEI